MQNLTCKTNGNQPKFKIAFSNVLLGFIVDHLIVVSYTYRPIPTEPRNRSKNLSTNPLPPANSPHLPKETRHGKHKKKRGLNKEQYRNKSISLVQHDSAKLNSRAYDLNPRTCLHWALQTQLDGACFRDFRRFM